MNYAGHLVHIITPSMTVSLTCK